MKISSRFAAISVALSACAGSWTALAQDMSVDAMRANIEAQIQAQGRSRQPPKTRALRLNNHQDTDAELYGPSAAAPVAAEPKPAPLKLYEIQFDYDSARLRPISFETLQKLSDVLRSPEIGDHVFIISGHTDNKGAAAYNRALSMRRAEAVVAALQDMGVAPKLLSADGVGMDRPLDGLPPSDPRNRRVEVTLYR